MIGNGFDLAHGLPTKYTDFLRFMNTFYNYQNSLGRFHYYFGYHCYIYEKYLLELFHRANREKVALNLIKELDYLGEGNVWMRYFNHIQVNENWIDFECEISKIIQLLDCISKQIFEQEEKGNDLIEIKPWQQEILVHFNIKEKILELKKLKHMTTRYLSDLDKLIRSIEIYLGDYILKYPINFYLPDISELEINKVLSFNYTNTYERIYNSGKLIEYDYIHGKADIANTIKSNRMVLGIDEYLSEEKKDEDVEFIGFKKFYQRIYKQTGCKYKEWIDQIKESEKVTKEKLEKQFLTQIPFNNFNEKNNVYIFGHSLDVTDKDILRDLILNDNVYTTIFYPDREELGKKIANLLRIIGQDELIRRTGGSTQTIEFKQQQDVVRIDS